MCVELSGKDHSPLLLVAESLFFALVHNDS